MYLPDPFQQNDPEKLRWLIANYPLATLAVNGAQGVVLDHIPLILTQAGDRQVLQGHLFAKNPICQTLQIQSAVTVVFQGPNSYISPNYYPTKKEHGKAVPTWNYLAVHVQGQAHLVKDKAWLLDMLQRLTDKQEAGQAAPWQVADAPADYIDKLLNAIVGIEVDVSSIVGKWKASQNQPEANRQGVIEALAKSDNSADREMARVISEMASDSN